VSSRWEEIGRALRKYVDSAGERGLAALAAEHAPGLRVFRDAAALIEHLHARDGSDDERDRLLGELVVAAKGQGNSAQLARALLWLAFWPALTALLRRSTLWSSDDADELAADLAEKFTVVVSKCDPGVVSKVAATLLWNTRRDFWSTLKTRAHLRAMECRLDGDAEHYASVPSAAEVVDALSDLESEIGADAELVLRCLVEGLTTREAARRCGVQREAIKKRLQRASARLRASALARRCETDVPDRSPGLPMVSRAMQRHGESAGGRGEERGRGRPGRSAHGSGTRTLRAHLVRLRRCGTGQPLAVLPPSTAMDTDRRTPELPVPATPAVPLIVLAAETSGDSQLQRLVSYCDVCRRWGEQGSEHVCGQNWSEHLLPVLTTLARRTS
jgi:DNA-directed RNA polymerase specialized sigma24 family protein